MTFCISDLHIGIGIKEKERERIIFEFLDMVEEEGERLFLLGDIFNFYFEYRSVMPKIALPLLYRLYDMKRKGVDVRLWVGNHDYWIKDAFLWAGIPIYREGKVFELYGKKIFFIHGDYVKPCYRSRFMKKLLRGRVPIKLFSLLHPDFGAWLGYLVTRLNRIEEEKEIKRYEVLKEFARKKLQEVDAVIVGHLHLPRHVKINEKDFIILGDWIENFTYAVIDGEGIKFRKFR